MAMRIGPGPVFQYEWLRLSRRWQVYALRSLFVAVILGGLGCLWSSRPSWETLQGGLTTRQLALFGQSVYATIAYTELTLILLAAPAATAGAVCLDKSRGTLLHVMATDLTDSEIVLGKLGAGLLPVVGLVFCVLPVLMLTSLLGGIDPATLIGSFAVSLGTAVFACTLAFALSVWGRKTHEVLSAVYLILIVWLAAAPIVAMLTPGLRPATPGGGDVLSYLRAANPYALLSPSYNEPAIEFLRRAGTYLGVCLAASLALAATAISQIRPATLRHRDEVEPTAGRWAWRLSFRLPRILPAPSLDANPVLWREWTRTRPTRWARWTWFGYRMIALGGIVLSLGEMAQGDRRGWDFVVMTNIYLVGVGLLLLSVRAATALSEERIRGSLDVLLSTPMSTSAIVAGKWWGTFRLVPALALAPGLLGFASCLRSGMWWNLLAQMLLIHGYGAAVTSAGLAVAVWVPRQGRALALAVGLYATACVGWVVFAVVGVGGSSSLGPMIAMGSPVFGAIFGTISLFPAAYQGPSREMELIPYGFQIWNTTYWAAAAGFYLLARLTFDARLGRAKSRGDSRMGGEELRDLLPIFRRPADDRDVATGSA